MTSGILHVHYVASCLRGEGRGFRVIRECLGGWHVGSGWICMRGNKVREINSLKKMMKRFRLEVFVLIFIQKLN